VIRIAVLVILALLCVELSASLYITLARAALPFADNGWADHAQIYALVRMAQGGPAYTAPIELNSYIYGPLYLWVVNALRALMGVPPGIVVLRSISMALGFLSLVPLLAVTAIIAPLAGIERRSSPQFMLALLATAIVGICTITHDLTFNTLHPDVLLFLIVATTLALYFALARSAIRREWLAAFVPLCVLAFLTKSNAVCFVPILIFAHVWAKRISWQVAFVVIAGALAASAIAFVALPQDVKIWTLIIPASEPISVERTYQIFIDLFGSRDGVYVNFIGAMLVATVVTGYAICARSGKEWAILIGGALVAAIITAIPAFLKQGGTWNNLVLIAVCCVPFTGLLVALPFRATTAGTLSRGLSYIGAAALALMTLSFALSNQQTPRALDVEHLANARAFAERLCRDHPKDRVYTTLFPDLFFGCPNSLYHSQWAIGDISWAAPKFTIGTTVDADPHTRYAAYVVSPHFGSPQWLLSNYSPIWSTPVIVGEWYTQYDHVPLTFYERKPGR